MGDIGGSAGLYTIVYGTAAQLYVVRGLQADDALKRAKHWSELRRPNVTLFCPEGLPYRVDEFEQAVVSFGQRKAALRAVV